MLIKPFVLAYRHGAHGRIRGQTIMMPNIMREVRLTAAVILIEKICDYYSSFTYPGLTVLKLGSLV